MSTRDPFGDPLLYGHRGAPRLHPENSLPSLHAALQLGVDALEIDVHMSVDGHVMVAHDADGSRMARVGRRIRETPRALIEAWDIAQGFEGPRTGAVRVPALDTILGEFPEARLNIDVKQSSPDMVLPLLELLYRHRAAERVLLTSFAHDTLSRIRRAGYGGQTGLSRREALVAAFAPHRLATLGARHARRGQRLQIPTSYGGVDLATPRLLDRFHRQGLCVDYWVVNEPQQARSLLDMGADGIVTDVPELIAPVFAEHARTQGWRDRHAQLVASHA